MNSYKHKIKQTILAAAMAATLGTTAITEQASANSLSFNISGWLTILNTSGTGALVNIDALGTPMRGWRTAVTGTMTFDTDTSSGTLTMQPFSFFGAGNASATNISFQDVDGPSGAGVLMLGNMSVDWNNNFGIPVSIVWDGEGMLDAINKGLAVGDTIAATNADFACDSNINCATPATDGFLFGAKTQYTLPIGPSPVATTTFDTTDIGTIVLGTNPSGTLPLSDDGIGGSPMKAGPVQTFNANFDFDNMTVTAIPILPVAIDIKPGSDTNSINLSSAGVVTVAILSAVDFDATNVDPTTVSLAGASVKMVGKSDKYLCDQDDVNSDGLVDLVCKVYTAQFMVEEGETIAILEAETLDGMKLRGEDFIRIVPDN